MKFNLDPTPQSATIEKLSNEGRGVARINGKATFIEGALPQEVVRFTYTRKKKDFDEGRLLEILQPSPLRVEPKCPHYHLCGGCSMQHLATETQIQLKQEQLLELLKRFARIEPESVLEPLKADSWNYRTKARLSVRYVAKKNGILIGFRERNNPRFITDIQQCPVLHKKLDTGFLQLRALLDSLDDKTAIAQIELSAGDEEVALIIRNLQPLSFSSQEKIRQFAQEHQFIIYLQPKGPDSVYRFYPEDTQAYLSYCLPLFGIQFEFQPNDFTQINASLNRLMVAQAMDLMDLQPEDSVLDLFCGLGNFSLPMAKFSANVMGIEGSQTMVERAKRNAQLNQITNAQFYAADLDDINSVSHLLHQRVSKVLIDPPRSGALAIVKQMELINPERIVYVSCNPVTLARDTEILVHEKGYNLQAAGVLDMFPHTAHVESMALFIKG